MAEIRFKENKLSIIFFLSDFLLLESVDIRSSHHLVEKLHRAIHRTLAENRFYFKTDNKSNQIKSFIRPIFNICIKEAWKNLNRSYL